MIKLLLVATVAVAVAGALGGDQAALVVVQVEGTLALLGLLTRLPASDRSSRRPSPVRDGRDRFASFERLCSAVAEAGRSARLVDLQLRPVLQHLVAAPLEQRGAAAVRSELGESAWQVIAADRRLSDDSHGGGLDRRQLEELVDRMETL